MKKWFKVKNPKGLTNVVYVQYIDVDEKNLAVKFW